MVGTTSTPPGPGCATRYGERFYRMWKYYLLASAAEFRARQHNLYPDRRHPRRHAAAAHRALDLRRLGGSAGMSDVRRLIPILTGRHRYDASLSLRGRAPGTTIEAPILAYLIETAHGRVLYDVGCDYRKIADPALRARCYGAGRLPVRAAGDARRRSGCRRCWRASASRPRDIDAVVLGHLHFDHAGGLRDFVGAEIHCHADEWEAARANADGAYFAGDFEGAHRWRFQRDERRCARACEIVDSPGHTPGHRSLVIELAAGPPVILAGDAADLQENLDAEIAPGLLFRDARGSIARIWRWPASGASRGWRRATWARSSGRTTTSPTGAAWCSAAGMAVMSRPLVMRRYAAPGPGVIASTLVSAPQMPPSSSIIFSQARRISGSKQEMASAT